MSKKGGAAKQKEEASYQPRDIVLGKLRGFPPWPGQVVDEDTAPKSVLKERPLGKTSSFYCVRFFPVGDHAWLQPKDISKLQLHEIQSYITRPKIKNSDLLRGYKTAVDPEKWEREMADRRAREEEAVENEPVDQLDEDEEEEDSDVVKPKASKKRKRETKEKPVKASKEAGKPKSSKRKNGTKKSNAMVESEDEGDAGPSSKSAAPASKKAKVKDPKEVSSEDLDNDPEAIKVKDMRHKLQRAFLSKAGPKPEDMAGLDKLFVEVEDYGMTIQYLQYSKIGKVMRHIAALSVDKIPSEDEYKFRDRAQALVNKWHNTVNSSSSGDAKPNGKTNGAPVPDSAMSEGAAPPSTAGVDGGLGDITMDTTLGDATMTTDIVA